MYVQNQLAVAADEMARLVGGVRPEHLDAPTPCGTFNVSQLLEHLISWAPIIEAVALRKPLTSGRPDEPTGVLAPGWREDYLRAIDRIVSSWRPDAAWEGTVDLGFAKAPASVIGDKNLCEFVVHGWDLARGTGQEFRCDPDVAGTTLRLVLETVDVTREAGMFGAEVPQPESATALERALGATGRNPAWTA